MNPILLELWREKHPQGLEQFALDFEKRNESCPPASQCTTFPKRAQLTRWFEGEKAADLKGSA